MNTQNIFRLLGAICASLLWSTNPTLASSTNASTAIQHLGVRGVVEFATKTNNGISFSNALTNQHHWYGITKAAVHVVTNASPVQYLISGEVRSLSSGAAAEQMPIFFQSTLHPPKLAALTDANGRFCFRVGLKQDERNMNLQMAAPDDASVLVGPGSIYSANSFDENLTLISGIVRRYPLKELAGEKPVQQGGGNKQTKGN